MTGTLIAPRDPVGRGVGLWRDDLQGGETSPIARRVARQQAEPHHGGVGADVEVGQGRGAFAAARRANAEAPANAAGAPPG